MIKPAALLMAGVMAAVTAGTYYGLDYLPPGLLPGPLGRAPAQEPKPAIEATAPQTTIASTGSSQPAAPAPTEQVPPTEQDLAEEPQQPAAPTPAPSENKPATVPAESKPAAVPAPVEPKSATAPTALAAEEKPEPARKAEPQAPKPGPKPAPKAKPALESETKAEAVASTEKATVPAASKARPPEADVIKPWWPDASKIPANQLKLMYAGQVKGEEAIALLFSSPLALDSVKQHAQVKAEGGAAVSGEWELGKNPSLVVFRGLKPGRYTVVLEPEVADSKGFMLGATLKGPVYVQAPGAP